MPPSQLKQLKASLRAEGLIGQQQSKAKKSKERKNGVGQEQRLRQASALQNIREQFNPFENQLSSRSKEKYDVTNAKMVSGGLSKVVKGRPGITKGFGEEKRKQTLLKEMHQRNKVGGIVDRRFGEADPTMAPEEKMLQRFMKEKQRNFKNNAMFNLEDDQEDAQLTHFGQALSLGKDVAAEIDGSESSGDDEESGSDANPRKRKRLFEPDAGDGEEDEDSLSTRPKSRKEMLHEVMAKSKLHKYERQQAKEDDEDEREKLDQELPELLAIMKGRLQLPGGPQMHQNPLDDQPEQPAQARASDLTKNQQYDKQLREMVLDRRSRPTDKTKTEEEKAQEKADHLHALEEQRLRRMRGEVLDEEEEPDDQVAGGQQGTELDDAQMFGLGSGIAGSVSKPDRGVEDEDDFILDDDLIASDSAPDISDDSEAASHSEDPGDADDDDREFIGDLANDDIRPRLTAVTGASEKGETEYPLRCYPCPQSHAEFRETVRGIPQQELPMVVRRIRALYSAELDSDNKRKLGVFATVLVTHIAYLADQPRHPPMAAVEQLIRHIHSLAKTYPIEVAEAFRKRLRSLHEERPTAPTPGDLVVFMAIQAIFPTSDHFHQVVTPAMLSMARYLSQKRPTNLSDLVTGSCIGTLCLQYQSLAKRYVPELLNYALNGIIGLAPTKIKILPNSAPQFELPRSLRIQGKLSKEPRRLRFWDVLPQALSEDEEQLLKESLLHTFLFLVNEMAKLWSFHAAFIDAFDPVQDVLQQVQKPKCQEKLGPLKDRLSETIKTIEILLNQARQLRRPLALHRHRPLAIKTFIPKFEESYNPDKHYDPDRERHELNKLKAEHKRERKAAMRELRKDANFIARETLREKKERDAEYDKKFKRLVAEIQGEEAHQAKEYEREKRLRKRKR